MRPRKTLDYNDQVPNNQDYYKLNKNKNPGEQNIDLEDIVLDGFR